MLSCSIHHAKLRANRTANDFKAREETSFLVLPVMGSYGTIHFSETKILPKRLRPLAEYRCAEKKAAS